MQRGLVPRPTGWRLWAIGLITVYGTFGSPAVTHAQPASDRGGEELGAFERPSGDERTAETTEAATPESATASAPGLRRSGERSFRRDAAETKSRSTGGRLLRTVLWLGFVIGLAVGTLHLVRRFFPGSVPLQNRNLVKVLGRGALSPKHQVVVTQVGGQILILGIAGDTMVRLGEVTDPEEAVRFVPREETFAGKFASADENYTEGTEYPEGGAAWTGADAPDPSDERLEPYRREVARLQSMVELWQRQDRLDERGTA